MESLSQVIFETPHLELEFCYSLFSFISCSSVHGDVPLKNNAQGIECPIKLPVSVHDRDIFARLQRRCREVQKTYQSNH